MRVTECSVEVDHVIEILYIQQRDYLITTIICDYITKTISNTHYNMEHNFFMMERWMLLQTYFREYLKLTKGKQMRFIYWALLRT